MLAIFIFLNKNIFTLILRQKGDFLKIIQTLSHQLVTGKDIVFVVIWFSMFFQLSVKPLVVQMVDKTSVYVSVSEGG